MLTNILFESFEPAKLRNPKSVNPPKNIKNINWEDLEIIELGDDGNNMINLGIKLPGENKSNDGIVLDIQLINDELYQPHMFFSTEMQGAGLGFKVLLKFIHDFGHFYSGDGRQQNKTQIPAIFDKLKTHNEIDSFRLPYGYLFILKNNPNYKYFYDKYINKITNEMITTINEYRHVFLNENNEPRMMSFTIPEKKDWIEQGENLGIRFMGKTYWIKDLNKKFFEDNIGNTIGFKYLTNNMYIEMPTILKQNIVPKNEKIDSHFNQFATIVQNSVDVDDAFNTVRTIPVDPEISQLFFKTYDRGDGMRKAWERFYNDVKSENNIKESNLQNNPTLNKVKNLAIGDIVKVYYLGTYETPDNALTFDAKIVEIPYIHGKDIIAKVKSIDSTGEKYLDDGMILFKYGRWVHAAKWFTKKMNRRSLKW